MPSATNTSPDEVTVLGLGLMGQALARALVDDGHPTTVWNRSPEKAEPLVARGARLAGSVGDAVAASDLVIACVSDDDAFHESVDPVGEAFDGRVLVNLTSSTSEQARETGRWAQRHGASYLDGAILAAPAAIGTGDAAILYSGPASAFDRSEPVLQTLAASTYLGDDHGLSSLYDVAVLSLMWNILNGFVQGAVLLGAAGVDAASFAPVAKAGIETVAGWAEGVALQIDEGTYPPVDATIDTHRAAMDHLIDEAQHLGVSAELPRFIKALADRAVAAGYGSSSYAAMAELLRKPAGA